MAPVRLPELLAADPPADGARSVLCIADGAGATWRISFDIPLRRLRERGAVRLTALTEGALEAAPLRERARLVTALFDACAPDILVLSRCGGAVALLAGEVARARGVAVIYHLDDDLLVVPRELGIAKSATYNDPARRLRMDRMIRDADLLYCSTPALARRMRRLALPRPPFAGALYCAASGDFAPYAPAAPRTIGYMGTAGHAHDLAGIVPAIAVTLATFADVRFVLFGTLGVPDPLMRQFPGRVARLAGVPDYAAFLGQLRGLGWSVALAPIAASPFNTVKADTKFVEYTTAGMPVVASDGPVYRRIAADGAGLLAATALDWAQAIAALLGDEDRAAAQVARAQARLRADYGVERLEAQLGDVFDQACRVRATVRA